MPELPEVGTVRRILEPQLAGRTVETVEVCNGQIIAHPEAEVFASLLQGLTIKTISRRGKFLTLHFASGDRLSLHLRMTGQLLVMSRGEPIEKHAHLILSLSDGNQLRYIDVRRFGRFWYFLYSDEILFAAGIYPGTKCAALDDADWERLASAIPEVILWGINVDQISPEEYLRGKGKEYRNTQRLRVYGRAGQPCPICGEALCRRVIGGRSSTYCPSCQKAFSDWAGSS